MSAQVHQASTRNAPGRQSTSTTGSNRSEQDSLTNDGDAMDVSPDGPASDSAMGPPPVGGQNNLHNATKIANARAQTAININSSTGSKTPSSTAATTNGGPAVMNGSSGSSNNAATATAAAAAASAASSQQPKVVQTAFIHKLYNMLEDTSIAHLISWSNTGDSFLISPTAEFSKALASYFKHTQISSFVRQLNMYGFHKVSDVFHSSSPETALWEFKHGNGNFKKGDLAGLKEIKRRASRQTLTHRDSFPAPTPSKPPPMPAMPVAEPPSDPLEARFSMLEQNLHDAHIRLARAEDHILYMLSKSQMLTDTALKCCQSSHELTALITGLVPDPAHQVHRDALNIQADITRHIDNVRNYESRHPPPPPPPPPASHRASFSAHAQVAFDNSAPLSPYQLAQDDRGRGGTRQASMFRNPFQPSAPAQYPISPERRGSYGLRPGSPLSRNPISSTLPRPAIPPTTERRNLAYSSPSLARRHTSGDIASQMEWAQQQQQQREQHGYGPGGLNEGPSGSSAQRTSPYTSGQSSAQYPSSPRQAPGPGNTGYQQIKDGLAKYQLSGSRSASTSGPSGSNAPGAGSGVGPAAHQQPSPRSNQYEPAPPQASQQPNPHALFPYPSTSGPWGPGGSGGGGSLRGPPSSFKEARESPFSSYNNGSSLPPSQRSSVAYLLNPADTAADTNEDAGDLLVGDEKRKRKRLV